MVVKDILTEQIIGCCFRVHKLLGPGFNEKIYHKALILTLEETGLKYETEKEFSISFLKKSIGRFRVDLVIEDKVIVEIKAFTGKLPIIFEKQLLAYLKASNLPMGLLINFSNPSCQIKRFVN